MDSPATTDVGKNAWQTYVSQRTKALPKNSLFGTALENLDVETARNVDVRKYDEDVLKERTDRLKKYDHKLPSRLKNRDGNQFEAASSSYMFHQYMNSIYFMI